MMADVIAGLWAAITVSAALGFMALALATLVRRRPFSHPSFFLGLVSSAVWLVLMAWLGPASVSALSVEAARNLSWLWFMASLWSGDAPRTKRISTVGWVYIGLFALQAIMLAVLWRAIIFGAPATLVVNGFATVQMLVSAGALVLLHNLFESTRTEKRHALGLPLSALGLLWAYDLNLYAITYLSGEPAGLMVMLRPMVMFAIAALFTLASLRPGAQAVQLSRPAAFRSLALAGIGGWLGILSLLALLLPGTGYDFGGLAQIGVLAATVAGAGLMLLSPRMRAHLRVWTAKHFYEHRYDYRAEWLRFTATLNRPETASLSIDARVIKALADIVESPAGILVLSAGGASTVAAIWPSGECRAEDDWSAMIDWMGGTSRIVQLDEVRSGEAPPAEISAIPVWLVADRNYWIAVPLVHLDHVEALVVLARPAVDRALDWEDFDLLRVAGRQAASHIAEARGSEALAESARFDEFHRRFAFMMHDVKNLASQMALLSRNAERHGEKPEFREDMVMTLRLCADRLSQLMQRLSHQERISVGKLNRVDLAMIARRVADARRSQHPVEVVGVQSAEGWGDRAMIEQLLAHLVQNAIEASEPDGAVLLRVGQNGDHATLRIEDKGKGMSPEFVRSELFRPFHSTKEGGFGVGAYQARQLAEAMGGTLSVESREGTGTIFTLSLAKGAQTTANPSIDTTTSEAA